MKLDWLSSRFVGLQQTILIKNWMGENGMLKYKVIGSPINRFTAHGKLIQSGPIYLNSKNNTKSLSVSLVNWL